MAKYWRPPQLPSTSASNSSHTTAIQESDYDKRRRCLLSTNKETGGWEAELRRYLNNSLPNITKDMYLIDWWQVHIALFKSSALTFL
jgi:hypothetical protein